MKVYIVVNERYHENGEILGVYDSLEKAMKNHTGAHPWRQDGFYVNGDPSRGIMQGWHNCVAACDEDVYDHVAACDEDVYDQMMLIYEWEVE